jgi:hypothetical protein
MSRQVPRKHRANPDPPDHFEHRPDLKSASRRAEPALAGFVLLLLITLADLAGRFSASGYCHPMLLRTETVPRPMQARTTTTPAVTLPRGSVSWPPTAD